MCVSAHVQGCMVHHNIIYMCMYIVNNSLINGDPGIMNDYKEGLISQFLLLLSLGLHYSSTPCVCV